MYKTLKEECYEANMQLPRLGLVLFTFGNVSAADRNRGVFAIKPSGVPYESLRMGDIVIMDYDANVVEGKMRPSSDTKTHALLYKTWEDIGELRIPTVLTPWPGHRPAGISRFSELPMPTTPTRISRVRRY